MWWGPTSMTKNHDRKWTFRPGQAGTQLHDILWAVHDEKNRGSSEDAKNIGEFLARWVVGGRVMRVSLVHVCACVRGVLALTKPE